MKGYSRMNEIIYDEIQSVKKAFSKIKEFPLFEYYVVRNHCVLGDYMLSMALSFPRDEDSVVRMQNGCGKPNHSVVPSLEGTEWVEGPGELEENAVCFFTVNCLDKRYQDQAEQDEVIARLEAWSAQMTGEKMRLICCAIVPQVASCPKDITCLAEREYDAYLAGKENTWQEAFYLRVEKTLRTQVRDNGVQANLLRYDNIVGPECWELVQSMDFPAMIREAKETGTVTVHAGDNRDHFTLLNIRECMVAALLMVVSGKARPGHVYNVTGNDCTAMDVKLAFYRQFPDRLSLHMDTMNPVEAVYHGLSNLKMLSTGWRILRDVAEICYRQGCYAFGLTYDMIRLLPVYNGRLEEIKHCEMNTLKFIDKVCRENNIQYFLAGGSLLGAIRHKDVIPWDDDIDVGMLREDYEKFRKVCPGLVPQMLTYEDANGEGGSHYHFDKIRLKNTYFSTRYSDHFRINDGVFLDILVYDQTSNHPLFQKLHIRLTSMWTRVINIKWWDVPRKKIFYRSSKLALPVMRRISWNWFHHVFERIVRHYEHKKNAEYVIDSMGLNIKKGAMRKEWMTEVEYVPFGDMMAPIPTGYDAYLTHLYSPHYMEYLPIDNRASGHYIARLDLGEYLFQEEESGRCRDLDIRGELFEQE